jgi:hypothetical protein
MASENPSRRRRTLAARTRVRFAFRRATLVLVATFLLAAAAPATALAYWDFSGYLDAGHTYGEAQAGTSGYWNIRLSRSNCNADSWLRRRSDSYWIWFGAPCSVSNYVDNYPLSTYNASHAKNGTSCCSVWANVRIDATV